ncbi:hypothetical protein KA005_77505 [bacterium]|nr:hypothetical protein [bacterium]
MLLPDKHIRLSESIIGFGSFVLETLSNPRTIDEIWNKYQSARQANEYPAKQSFDNLILAICFLYSIGVVSLKDNGKLAKCV